MRLWSTSCRDMVNKLQGGIVHEVMVNKLQGGVVHELWSTSCRVG